MMRRLSTMEGVLPLVEIGSGALCVMTVAVDPSVGVEDARAE